MEPPKVTALTTDGGRARFNPNIYSEGKVCLSILGTWPGRKGEQWSSAQSTESILLSIQSLMSSNPYANEPGFETATLEGDERAAEYAEKIQHENIRLAVVRQLEDVLGITTFDGGRNLPGENGSAPRKRLKTSHGGWPGHVPSITALEAMGELTFQQQWHRFWQWDHVWQWNYVRQWSYVRHWVHLW